MQKHALLFLLTPMLALGMQDPSNFHHPCEAPLWKQAAKLAKARTWNNIEYIGAAIGTISLTTWKANAAITAANTAASAAANAAAFTTPLMVDIVGEAIIEAELAEMGLMGLELSVGAGAHAMESLATVMVVNPEPVSKVTTFTVAVGVIGLAGLYYFGDQTVRWAGEVLEARDNKKAFLAEKARLIKIFNEEKAKNEVAHS